MSLLISAFEGFSDQDFETYASARWSNNRYNLPRMKVKERLTALARAALPTLEGWSLDASSEIPDVWNGRSVQDQWVYLIRDASARARLEPLLNQKQSLMAQVQDPAQHHQHLILGLRLDVEGLAFGLWLHAHAAVDRAHVLARAAAEPEGLAAALAPLEMAPSALLARLRVAAMEPWLFVGERLPRDEVEALGGDIEARVAAQLEALSGLWRFAAWDEAHDHGAALAQLSALEAARAARAVTLAQQQEVAEAERAQRQEEAIARA
ncbi:hypothetical protein KKB55_18195, partial [Myxococcota bacterium]|nr:hypothetical protein [Myxococcota bacterium]